VNRRWKAGREDTGFIKWIVVRPDVRRDGIGGMLLDAVQAKFAAMGMREIFFGGSAPWYLLPGVPADEEPLRKLLVSRGWDLTSKRINLYLDSETIAGAEPVTPTGVTITLVASGERGSILDFVETNFSVSWAIESEEVFRQPDAFMLKACDAAGDTIGFVAIGATNRNWLGPMGLIEAQQGRGVGKALLLTALAEVHKRGMERICIPWAAEGFYIHCLGPLQRLEFTKATRQL
jgi:GNAT superfamily N-acetyltransferase